MQLIPVNSTELAVGQPLPWDVFDDKEQPVLARGSEIADADQLAEFTRMPLFRDGSPDTATDAAAPASSAEPATAAKTSESEFSFADAHLYIGMRLQFEMPAKLGGTSKMVRLIGYLEGACLFVTAPEFAKGTGSLIEGDEVRVRVFSGQHAFGFSCHVDRVLRAPIHYLHLSVPRRIVGKAVRNSRRVRTQIETKLVPAGGAPVDGMICNLSATGAEVHVVSEPARPGDAVTLEFGIAAHGVAVQTKLRAVIRSLAQCASSSPPGVRCGVEFRDLSAEDTLQIQSLVYQELVERPETMV